MNKRLIIALSIICGLACTGGVVLADQGSQPAATAGAGSEQSVKVVRGSDLPSASPSDQTPSQSPAGASQQPASTPTDSTQTTTQTQPSAPASPSDQSATAPQAGPAAPTLVSSRWYCQEMRPDGSLYDVAPFTSPAAGDVEVQLRRDTYSDGSAQVANLGPDHNTCGVATVDY